MPEHYEELRDPDDPCELQLLQSPSQQTTLRSFFGQASPIPINSEGPSVATPATPEAQAQGESSDQLSEDDRMKLAVPHAIIWHYFDKVSKETARCRAPNCGKIRNTPTGTTTLLIRHLSEHPSLLAQYSRLQQEKIRATKLRSAKKSPKRLKERTVLFPLDPRGPKAQTITSAIALFLCKGLQPYSVVEEPGFKHLVSTLEPRYKIPSRTAFTRTVIPDLYKKLKKKMEDRLDAVRDCLESVCFTTDIWTSRKLRSFLAFTIQFINEDFFMERFTLECQPFPGCHDAAAICQRMHDMVESILLESQRIKKYVVSDSGSNMLAALEQPSEERRLDEEIAEILRHEKDWEHRKCFNHAAQLAINDAKKELGLNNVTDKVSQLVNRYHKSKNAKELLEQYQKEHSLPPHELVQRCKTRWDSDYRMLERCVEQKAAIVSETSAAGEDNLTASEWKLAEGFVEVLRPVGNHTAEMGSESGPTASMILPVVFEIESELQEFIQKAPRGSGIQFARKVLSKVEDRFEKYREDLTCITATIIDPRYKDLLESDRWPASAKEILERQAKEKLESRIARGLVESNSGTSQPVTAEEPPTKRPRWKFLQSRRGASVATNSDTNSRQIKDEVESYLLLPTIGAEEDPLSWWRANQTTFPNLALVARHYLTIAATETSSERVASVGSNTVTPKRTNISSAHLKEMVFCHDNATIPILKASIV